MQSCDELAELIDWYDGATTELFREYAYDDFQPTIVSRVFPTYEFPENWVGPGELDDAESFAVAMYSERETKDGEVYQYLIEVTDDTTARLIFEHGEGETELDSQEYESGRELKSILNGFFENHEFNFEEGCMD